MLLEWLEARLMPAAPEARRLGAVDELVAVRARAKRLSRAWSDHVAKAREAVLRVAEKTPGRGLVVVLGSGWLLEVPLEALAARFDRVLLVDLVVPRAVRAQARTLGNVDWRVWDVTGVHGALAAHPKVAPAVADPAPLPPEALEADLVVSSNMLSQLPMSPRIWMDRHGLPRATQDAVAEALIRAHLTALGQCLGRGRGTVCLLSDFEREERDSAMTGGAVRYDLLHGVRPRVDGPRWWWSLAPEGEEGKTLSVRHKVLCGVLETDPYSS
ncbi:MAG: hypothetical protein K9H25_13025 [Rhodospirillum sp.]|nr:hypothetical protein [Rhodospirillum sp.]MCF8489287.1 hypothetical protein [Rhodospirillum sp.]MCF8502008.1 hypothetical protein [Rhodospirillum sp.]